MTQPTYNNTHVPSYTWRNAIHPKHLISPFVCKKDGIKNPLTLSTADKIRAFMVAIMAGIGVGIIGAIVCPWLGVGLGIAAFLIYFYADTAMAKLKKINGLSQMLLMATEQKDYATAKRLAYEDGAAVSREFWQRAAANDDPEAFTIYLNKTDDKLETSRQNLSTLIHTEQCNGVVAYLETGRNTVANDQYALFDILAKEKYNLLRNVLVQGDSSKIDCNVKNAENESVLEVTLRAYCAQTIKNMDLKFAIYLLDEQDGFIFDANLAFALLEGKDQAEICGLNVYKNEEHLKIYWTINLLKKCNGINATALDFSAAWTQAFNFVEDGDADHPLLKSIQTYMDNRQP